MFRRLNLYRFYLRLVCYALPSFTFVVSGYMRFGLKNEVNGNYDPYFYLYLLLLTTLVWAIMAEHYSVCSVDELFRERTGIRAALPACATTYTVVLVLLFFLRSVAFSRVFIIVSAFALLLSTLVMRAAFRTFVRHRMDRRKPLRLVIVGADKFALRVARRLVTGPFSVCRIVCYVRLPGQSVAVKDAPVYEMQHISAVDLAESVDDIVLALPATEFSAIPTLIAKLKKVCLPVRLVVDLGEGIIVRDKLFQFGRLQMLDLATTPVDSLNYSILKRGFDICFSLFVILVTAPVMAILALTIRLTSPGPALFIQRRVGLNGHVFSMYKFRTMRTAPVSDGDTVWTVEEDPRCTPLGALLRRTSLDELPQFFNVLKGDMSVVGPRPERPHFVEKFLKDVARYNSRHRLKAGITGWAQVNGWRGNTSIKRRLEYDLYYLQNWSFSFDLRIIFLTLWSGLFGKNAY